MERNKTYIILPWEQALPRRKLKMYPDLQTRCYNSIIFILCLSLSPRFSLYFSLRAPSKEGLDKNYCRNPSRDKEGPWCYTKLVPENWEQLTDDIGGVSNAFKEFVNTFATSVSSFFKPSTEVKNIAEQRRQGAEIMAIRWEFCNVKPCQQEIGNSRKSVTWSAVADAPILMYIGM